MIKRLILTVTVVLAGCSGKSERSPVNDSRPELIQQVDKLSFYQLHCNSFDDLSLEMKTYAYYLFKACLSCQDMSFEFQVTSQSIENSREIINRHNRNIIGHLENALGFAPEEERQGINELIGFLQGDEIENPTDPQVHRETYSTSDVNYFIGFPDGIFKLDESSGGFTAIVFLTKKDTDFEFELLFGTAGVNQDFQNIFNALGNNNMTLTNLHTNADTSNSKEVFIMPELELETNRMGGVRDIRIAYPRDFRAQMLRFTGVSPKR